MFWVLKLLIRLDCQCSWDGPLSLLLMVKIVKSSTTFLVAEGNFSMNILFPLLASSQGISAIIWGLTWTVSVCSVVDFSDKCCYFCCLIYLFTFLLAIEDVLAWTVNFYYLNLYNYACSGYGSRRRNYLTIFVNQLFLYSGIKVWCWILNY